MCPREVSRKDGPGGPDRPRRKSAAAPREGMCFDIRRTARRDWDIISRSRACNLIVMGRMSGVMWAQDFSGDHGVTRSSSYVTVGKACNDDDLTTSAAFIQAVRRNDQNP